MDQQEQMQQQQGQPLGTQTADDQLIARLTLIESGLSQTKDSLARRLSDTQREALAVSADCDAAARARGLFRLFSSYLSILLILNFL